MREMKKNEICYTVIVAVLGISLLAGFAEEVAGFGLGRFSWAAHWVTSPVALAVGFAFALVFGKAFPVFNGVMAKKLLQYSVVGLGFGMNVDKALASGGEGMLFTVVSVFGTLLLGWLFGRKLLGVDSQTSYLLSSGTAICGGSAIAAVGSVLRAKAESMSVALGVVFVLNGIALFVFPYIGDVLGLSMKQFGMWAAIAIHDTSSVVGAGAAYDQMHPDLVAQQGVSALEVATTIKLTRALWIVVLALLTPYFFRRTLSAETCAAGKPWYANVPRFIVWFVVAIFVNTYVIGNASLVGDGAAAAGASVSSAVGSLAKHLITLSLFFIGASLTRETLRSVGMKPLLQGVLLWVSVSVLSLAYILGVA